MNREEPALIKLDLGDRKRYIDQVHTMNDDDTIVISCDETPLVFGGAEHTHISAPQGINIYADEASDPRFSKMQWDAACSDIRVKRPWLVWDREEKGEITAMTVKLEAQNERLRAEVDHNRMEATKPGTIQYQYLEYLNHEV